MNSNLSFSSKEIEEFQALLSLTNLYLSQNFAEEAFLFTEKEVFKDYPPLSKEKPKQTAVSFSAPKPPSLPLKPILKPVELKPQDPPAIKEEREVKTEIKKPSIAFETTSFSIPHETFSDLKSLMKALFPKQVILEDPPKELVIKTTKLLVIFAQESGKELLFLEQLTKALSLMAAPALLLSSSDKRVDALLKSGCIKLLLGTQKALEGREHPSLMLEISSYLNQPEKKADLWNEIKNALSN